MSTCFGCPRSNQQCSPEVTESQVLSKGVKAREARITAFALTIITLALLATAFGLFGVGTLAPEVTMGLGIIPYVSGIFIGAVAIGVFLGAVAHLAVASVRDSQARAWQEEADRGVVFVN